MMRNMPFLFWCILIVTLLAIIINLPKTILVSFTTPRLPIINISLSVNRSFQGFDPKRFGIARDFSFRKGLDLEGGTSITLRADMKDVQASNRDVALSAATSVIERRVNFFGVSEPVVQSARVNNDYRIIVEIPGVTDVNQAVNLIGKTAKLEFRELVETATPSAFIFAQNTRSIGLSGADLQSAQVGFDQSTGQPVVQFQVAPQSQNKFFETTRKLIGKPMAIVLDNEVVSAPTVQDAIRDNGQITGNFTTEQAQALATQLNAGALPVSLSILQQQTIGATLGAASLHKSLFAGILGFFVIAIFMIVLYGRLGIIAIFALLLYTLYMLAIFRFFSLTLTLAGIAGFILSIGMAVDANILIFERMREELRAGKSRQQTLSLGFSRAWTSIRDSNVATIITCLILIYFGTGIVRGFAITLLIGVLVSMFSAIVVTRTFLSMFYRN